MKVESTTVAGQRETTCHEEKERAVTYLEISYRSNVFVHCFCLYRFASDLRPLFGVQNGTRKFSSVHTSLWLVSNRTSLWLMSLSRQIFLPTPLQTESSSYLRLVSEGGLYPLPMVPHLCRRFFQLIFN